MLSTSHLALLSSEGRDLLISLVALAAILLRGAQLLGWLRLVIPSRHATFLALLALASCGGEYWFTGNFISAAIHLVGLMSFLVTIRATTPLPIPKAIPLPAPTTEPGRISLRFARARSKSVRRDSNSRRDSAMGPPSGSSIYFQNRRNNRTAPPSAIFRSRTLGRATPVASRLAVR
jgi:hypothetical protein